MTFNYEKFLACLSLIAVLLLTTGVNRCQESYNFAVQSSLPTNTAGVSTGTATNTPTGSQTPDEDEETPTPTVTGTPPTMTPEATEPSTEESLVNGNEFFQISKKKKSAGADVLGALSQLSNEDPTPAPTQIAPPANSDANQAPIGNWLGQGFGERNQEDTGDADNDTFSDTLEGQYGSDPTDPNSFPPVRPVTDLSQRLMGVDDDGDGLPNSDEAALGTDSRNVDSDGDGVADGAEIRSGSDPLKNGSIPLDSDGDGLSDQFERTRGLDWRSSDGDGDGLRDDIELSLGTDVSNPDSDSDGLQDGKEVQIGSDPTIAEQ